jgi:hypothetical protein
MLMISDWYEEVNAVVMAYYPGQEAAGYSRDTLREGGESPPEAALCAPCPKLFAELEWGNNKPVV